MLNDGGFSAYQMAFGSSPADLCSWQDGDSDLDFVRNISIPSQFTLQLEPRVMAQEEMQEGMATSKLRRISDRNRTFEGADLCSHNFLEAD